MRSVYLQEQRDESAFIEKAARYFEEHPQAKSFAENDPEPGEPLALRWGPDRNCIVLVKLDQYFEPRNYQNAIRAKPAASQGEYTPGEMAPGPEKTGNFRQIELWNVALEIQVDGKTVIHGALIPEKEEGDVPSWYLRPGTSIALTEENSREICGHRAAYLTAARPFITTLSQGKLVITIHSFV